uniref:Uncharacterized protein n=1 Tax=viral metagenome TaxID=1070528 RepID=A0A6C0HKF6_9ZZZZ
MSGNGESATRAVRKPRKPKSTTTAESIADAANAAFNVNNTRHAAEAAAASSAPPATNASPVVAASTSSLPTSSSSAATTAAKNSSSRSVSFHPNAKMSNGPKASPKTAASLAEAAIAPVVVAAATNAAANAKDRELCFIYSNALTKDKFNKGCIIVYKGATSSPDHSATMLEQLLAQKDIQAVEGGLQKSFVHPVDDKTSLFIAYVEVTTMPTDEQIIAMKKAISLALPKMGGKRKRFHTKKRHAKKRTTRRS